MTSFSIRLIVGVSNNYVMTSATDITNEVCHMHAIFTYADAVTRGVGSRPTRAATNLPCMMDLTSWLPTPARKEAKEWLKLLFSLSMV